MDIMASAVYARDGVAVSARYRVVPLTAKLVVLVVLFTTDRLTITSLGIAYLIAYPTMALLMAVVVGRRYGVSVRPGRPHMASARNSALYSTAISASVMQSDGDKVVMTAANVGADTGLYAAAYRSCRSACCRAARSSPPATAGSSSTTRPRAGSTSDVRCGSRCSDPATGSPSPPWWPSSPP
jgi:hypothetical protein